MNKSFVKKNTFLDSALNISDNSQLQYSSFAWNWFVLFHPYVETERERPKNKKNTMTLNTHEQICSLITVQFTIISILLVERTIIKLHK